MALEQSSHYLLVRPMGLGEDVIPRGEWRAQKEKHKDKSVGVNMAKLDCARFMVEEALNPTQSKTALVVGTAAEKPMHLFESIE